MTTEVDLYAPAAPAIPGAREIDSWIGVASQAVRLAREICDTPFVPEGLRGSAPAVAAAILAGRELNLGPMTSLANINVIRGKPALSAVLMRALIQAEGHQWEDVEVTDTRCVVRGRRKGESGWTEASFNADQARRAKIDLGGYPQDKLYARATSRLARRKFADVIAGMPYSAEELEDGAEPDAVPDAASNGHAPAPAAPRTARRRQAAAPPPPGQRAGNEPAAGAAPQPDQPPLPGEDEPAPPRRGNGITGVIQAHFRRLGFTGDEREQRLIATGQIAGRDITSTNDLTPDEHKAVADTLARCRDREALITLLAAAGQDADAEASDE
jgi:hypothetical protein